MIWKGARLLEVVFDAIPPQQIRAAYNIIEKDLQKVISDHTQTGYQQMCIRHSVTELDWSLHADEQYAGFWFVYTE